MRTLFPTRAISATSLIAFAMVVTAPVGRPQARESDEIVANLAGGRVIVDVARELIVFAAIDEPLELKSVPPRVVELDATHVGVLLGASEWQTPADPKAVRLDRDVQRIGRQDPHYAPYAGDAEPDLETMGTEFLEKLRPLVSQLHHKLQITENLPILEVVVVGYAKDYGPEVWTIQYRMEQEEIATRGDFWQTRILRPRFEQLYPPEKHSPHLPIEARFPLDAKGPTLADLIQGNDPRIARLRDGDQRFLKVVNAIQKGEAQKAVAIDSVDFMRAVVPLIAPNAHFTLATMSEDRGFQWVLPPEEPIEKAKEDKNRPPEAPSLRKRPKPEP
jgi:hypothetical protein